jgi:hypothetical protein
MRHHAGQFTSDGTVHCFRHRKVGGKQDIKEALMDLCILISERVSG